MADAEGTAGGTADRAAEAKAIAELSADVAHLSQTVKRYPEKFRTVLRTVQSISSQADRLGQLLAILLLVFIVHQLFLWVDRDPEVAFERAALAFEVAEVVWDSHGIVWNALTDVVNAGVIPIWNAASFYLVEPIVVLILEIFSLVFTQRHYAGLFSEADFPYSGLDCTKSYEASEFCGRYEAYAARLEAADKAPYFVNETQGPSVGVRRLSAANPEVYTFGIATARRLSELTDDELFVAPSFDSEQVTTGLDDASSVGITLGAPVADVGTSVAFNVLQSSFSVIMDVIFIVLKSLMEAARWVIKSGLIATIMNIGIEFLIILCRHQIEPPTNRVVSPPPRCAVTEVAIPSLMAVINALMCAIDLFQPSTWTAQFECSARRRSNPKPPNDAHQRPCARSRGQLLPRPRRARRHARLHLGAALAHQVRQRARVDDELAHRAPLLPAHRRLLHQGPHAPARPGQQRGHRQHRARERRRPQPGLRVHVRAGL